MPMLRPTLTLAMLPLVLGAAHNASCAVLQVGSGMAYPAPCAAIAAARPGDTIEIDARTVYKGDTCRIATNFLTIRGVNGRPRIDAAGKAAEGKGVWVISGEGVTVENVEIFGARVADRNGAALRVEGKNFTLRRSFLHDNENGLLSGASPDSHILIENCEFGHNGDGSGQSHNVYVGKVANLSFQANYSHDANVGHNLKSRARSNSILYNRFSSGAPGEAGSTASGKPSYEIDLPDGGIAYVMGNVIQQPAENENSAMLAFGEEGASNPEHALYVVNNTFLNDDKAHGTFIKVGAKVAAPALLVNNIFAGVGTMSTQANSVARANYQAAQVGFSDRARYDLHPTDSARVINAGAAPPRLPSGAVLRPTSQYKHVAASEPRPVVGALDIGAYQTVIVQPAQAAPWYR
ncbi:right-handed parallel beta-helix repeat-containing protein [Janthinobacterium sp.]|uniref:right-handed parallel beta-helix repeat-containing protein n=1 Tax=Janthinobacterium sp. TaxID=1871054 RepID=UPI00293D52EB|nr:right-handed parallel beta-helix repeat-containing protein [Janthinobacterium sp.]